MFVSAERLCIGILALIVIAIGCLVLSPKQAPLPYREPSVPSLIPPPLSCACGTTRTVSRPFNAVCYYCRNTITVQPSASGEIGAVRSTLPLAKAK